MPTKLETKDNNKLVLLSNDLMFKFIFGTSENKRFTSDLLETLFDLDKGSLKDIVITNSVALTRKKVLEHKFELDILVKLPNGGDINIEMQNYHDKNSEIKNTLYVMTKFVNNLKSGDKYASISKITQVDFLKNNKLPKHNDEVIRRYGIMNYNDPNDLILGNLFKIIIVDVDAKNNLPYNNINKRFELWRKLIGANTDEEIYALAKKDESIKDVIKKMEEFSSKNYVQDYFSKERLHKSQLEDAQSIGSYEEKVSIAKKMLEKDIPINEISEITNLSVEEIENLKQNKSDEP